MPHSSRGMTLSSSMWDEWLSCPVKGQNEALDEIRGILCGLSRTDDIAEGTGFSSGRLWVFRRLSRLWPLSGVQKTQDFPSLLSIPRSMKGRVLFYLPPSLFPLILPLTGGAVSLRKPDWLRGLWGSCGGLYIPKTGYYLSFRAGNEEVEKTAAAALKKGRFSIGRRQIQGKFEITLRNQEEIVTLLARFGLGRTSLALEEKAIVRSMRNRANKLVNCDASNIRKSLEAASRQMEIARSAMALPGFEALPFTLKEMVCSRLSNPSATLEELGKMLSPPVSKSTVKYRWKKLEEMAGSLASRRERFPIR